jgi:putative glycosyltransferase (TIGR04372 family)
MNHESISKGESILSKNRVEESLSKESRLWLNSRIADEFVVIHLRNTGRNERRDVGVLEYLPALLELEKSGLQIVTIGPKLELNNMINVVHVADKSIQPYLFSKAKFAITSSSGPALLPGLFGTPNLVTNITSLGRTMINCNESTFYLPKSVTFKGRIMTFREILDSNIAYDEQEHKELAKLEYRMINNTEQELLLAIKWMLDKVEDGFSVSNTIDNNVRDIQDSMKAVSHGRLIPTYIETSKEFLD